jgi:large repetitive protein
MKKMKITLCLFLLLTSMISLKAQVTQGFEGLTFPPAEWSQFGVQEWNQASAAYSNNWSSYSAKCFYNTGSTNLVTPRLTPTSTINTFKFWIRKDRDSWDTSDEYVKIKVSTTGNGEFDSWTTLYTLDTNHISTTYVEKTVDLSAYAGQNIYIAIEVVGNDGNSFYFDDITMPDYYVASCAKPITFTSVPLSTTATISWAGEAAGNYNVEYRIVGDPTWISTTSTTNSIALSGLTPSSNYEIHVQKNCGTEVSEWSTTATFNTICAPATIPYLEGFESIASNNQLPSCMAATNLGGQVFTYTSAQSTYNRSAHTGNKYLSFMYDCNDWAFTPTFDLTSGASYDFSFWYKCDGQYAFDSLKVYVGNGQTATAMTQQMGTSLIHILNTTYQKFTGTFTPAANGIYCFGINVMASASPWYLTIDDIGLNLNDPLVCAAPALVNSSNNTSSTINLTWDGTAANYRVQYRATGSSTWSYSGLITTATTTLSGLSPFQSYEIQVRSICSTTDSSSLSTLYIGTTAQTPATLPYTASFESDPIDWAVVNAAQTNYWVAGTAIATDGTRSMYITNDGTANAYTTSSAASVSHIYRDIQFPTSTTGFTLSFDWKCVGEYNYDYLKVYLVDVNTNPTSGAALLDADRIGDNGYNSQSAWQNGIISLPASLSGTTKRLVFSWKNDNGGGTNPPAAIDNISIMATGATSTCNAPTLLYTNNVTENSATLAWASPAPNFNVQYRLNGTSTWTSAAIYAHTYDIFGLTSGSLYEFRVQAICSETAGDTSAWSTIATFTTDAATPYCAAPTTLNASLITQTSATINWTSSATSYNVQYRETGAATWTSTTATTTSLALSGLTAATAYEFKMQAICSATAGDTSSWTLPATFTTLPILNCICPSLLTASNISTTSAQLSWTNGGTETSWNIRFKKSTSTIYSSSSAITQKPYVVNGLQLNSAYVWNIQANCSATPGDTSCWSEEGAYNTLNDVSITENDAIDFSIYSDHQTINILNKSNATIKSVVIYDLLGQEVGRYSINSNDNVLINTNLAKSHYLVKVLTNNQVITKKVTIQ